MNVINCPVSIEFIRVHNLVKRCAATEHFRFALTAVYVAEEGSLVASDSHQLVEHRCDEIPSELMGKCIISLDEAQAEAVSIPYPPYKQIFEVKGYRSVYFEKFPTETRNEEHQLEHMVINNHVYTFWNYQLENIRQIIGESVTVLYNPFSIKDAVKFIGRAANMMIIPYRSY